MKARSLFLIFGVAFCVTLAVIIGQRLTSEAMAVMVGVVAGVAASIPTSLIVVWLATRLSPQARTAPEPRPAPERTEPRIVVMAQPVMDPRSAAAGTGPVQAGYQNYAGYPALPYPGYSQPAAPPPRRFTVIGGGLTLDESEPPEEVVWQR